MFSFKIAKESEFSFKKDKKSKIIREKENNDGLNLHSDDIDHKRNIILNLNQEVQMKIKQKYFKNIFNFFKLLLF